jgi:hypothetical protein
MLKNTTIRVSAAAVTCVALLAALRLPEAGGQGRGREHRDDYHSVRGADRPSRREDSHPEFTRSESGRRFENGVSLRSAVPVPESRAAWFPGRVVSYPHYAFAPGPEVFFSPYHHYGRVFPPYVSRSAVIIAPPSFVYVEIPIITGSSSGARRSDYDNDYYLNRRNADELWKQDPELKQAVYDLEDAFRDGDIALLAPLTADGVKIAIYDTGKYAYSLQPGDYLDITRDFMRTAHTTNFSVYRVHHRAAEAYQLFAKHDYRNDDGTVKSTYLCIVLEQVSRRWTITQVETSPYRLDR